MKLTEDDIFVDKWDGIIPNNESMIKIYCNEEKYGIELKQQIVENQNITDSVTMILKIAFEQRERLVILLNNESPHNDISQKEFDRIDIIINALCPMMHHNTGKDIYAKHSQPEVKE